MFNPLNLLVMKSLRESISEVMKSGKSMSSKSRELKRLGVQSCEIPTIIRLYSEGILDISTITFGVEIECSVLRKQVRDSFERTGVAYEYEGYNHVDRRTHYKFVTDSSVTGDSPIECVSPILTGNAGMASLKKCVSALNEAGATVNSSCGLHVHIGAQDLSEAEYANVFNNYYYLQDIINTFMAPSRRNSRWARPLSPDVTRSRSMYEVRCALDHDRYKAVNPMSYDRHKTIEFRQHGGSVNYKKISMWATFCAKLVVWSKKNRLTDSVASIDDIKFLTDVEKAYFKARVSEFANRQAA